MSHRVITVENTRYIVTSVAFGAKDTIVFAAPVRSFKFVEGKKGGWVLKKLGLDENPIKFVNPKIENITITPAVARELLAESQARRDAIEATPERVAFRAARRAEVVEVFGQELVDFLLTKKR